MRQALFCTCGAKMGISAGMGEWVEVEASAAFFTDVEDFRQRLAEAGWRD